MSAQATAPGILNRIDPYILLQLVDVCEYDSFYEMRLYYMHLTSNGDMEDIMRKHRWPRGMYLTRSYDVKRKMVEEIIIDWKLKMDRIYCKPSYQEYLCALGKNCEGQVSVSKLIEKFQHAGFYRDIDK